MQRDLDMFETGHEKDSRAKLILWWATQNTIFGFFATPNVLRVVCLKAFGAKIGSGVLIRRGVKVHFPWNLTIGNASWIGEQVWFINHVPIIIGSNVCVSQDSILSSGSHDMHSATLAYRHASIEIKDGAWLCLRSTVLAGVTVGENSVVSAGEVLRKSLPDNSFYMKDTIFAIKYDKD